MAKELPYFQFEPAEYLTKDISFLSLSTQGLFINLCAYYWQRQCQLTKAQILRRLSYPDELNELINEGIIELNYSDDEFEDEEISIKFLDFQYDKATSQSYVNAKNGAKGGRPPKAKLKPNESELKAIREEEIREEEKKEKEKIEQEKKKEQKKKREKRFKSFWNLYNKKSGIKTANAKFHLLDEAEIDLIFKTLPKYIASTPDLKYRKNPSSYLNQKTWNDEIDLKAFNDITPESFY